MGEMADDMIDGTTCRWYLNEVENERGEKNG